MLELILNCVNHCFYAIMMVGQNKRAGFKMYTPPIQEQKFIIEHLIGIDSIVSSKNDDARNQDIIDKELVWSILDEAGKFASTVLAPLNHSGDKQNSKITQDGDVITPDGFKKAYESMCEAG